jgi:hypothetical protein
MMPPLIESASLLASFIIQSIAEHIIQKFSDKLFRNKFIATIEKAIDKAYENYKYENYELVASLMDLHFFKTNKHFIDLVKLKFKGDYVDIKLAIKCYLSYFPESSYSLICKNEEKIFKAINDFTFYLLIELSKLDLLKGFEAKILLENEDKLKDIQSNIKSILNKVELLQLGVTSEELLSNMRLKSKEFSDSILNELGLTDSSVVSSSSQELWTDFLEFEGYNDYIRDLTEYSIELINRISSSIITKDFDDALFSINWNLESYRLVSEIKSKLIQKYKDISRKLQNSIIKLKREEPKENDFEIYKFKQAISAINDIINNIEVPRYNNCLCFTGSLGSGKSQTIYDFVNQSTKNNMPIYFISLNSSFSDQNITDQLMFNINSNYSYKFINFQSFYKTAYSEILEIDPKHSKDRIVIVIDDLHLFLISESNNLNRLYQMIRDFTKFKKVRFLLTIQDNYLDCLTPKHEALKNYFYISKKSLLNSEPITIYDTTTENTEKSIELVNIAGWYHVDMLDYYEKIGQKIIGQFKKIQYQPFILKAKSLRVLINIPLIAKIIINSMPNFDYIKIADLNYTELGKCFWDIKFTQIFQDKNDYDKNIIRDILKSSSIFICQQPNEFLKLNKLKHFLEEKLHVDYTIFNYIIQRLRAVYLLKDILENDTTHFDTQVTYKMFWSYLAATELLYSYEINPENLKQCKDLIFELPQDLISDEDLIEYLLLLTCNYMTRSGKKKDAKELLYSIIVSPKSKTCCAYFAATKLNYYFQKKMIGYSINSNNNICRGQRDCFSILYFLGFSSNEILSGNKLQVLSKFFIDIKKFGLQWYFLYTVKSILAKTKDEEDIFCCLTELNKSEILGYMPEISNFAYDRLKEIASNNFTTIVKTMIRFLKHEKTVYFSEFSPESCSSDEWKRYYFREFLLSAFMLDFVKHDKLNSFSNLNNFSWFEPGKNSIDLRFTSMMQREFTIALGGFYRSRFPEIIQDYIEHCLSIFRSGRKFEILAFYSIYHTLTKEEQKYKKIDDELVPIFRRIINFIPRTTLDKHKIFLKRNKIINQ